MSQGIYNRRPHQCTGAFCRHKGLLLDNTDISRPHPACSAIGAWNVLGIAKAADVIIIPIMVFVQSIATLKIFFKLVVIPVVAMPALVALPFLRITASLAW